MKTKLLLLLLAFTSFVNAQNATFYNGFESVTLPPGWSSNGVSRITTQSCNGTASMSGSTGQYAGVQLVSPNYLSDGQAIRLSVNYKLDYNGIIYLNYSINDGVWVVVANTSTSATSCTVLSGVIASNVVPAGSNVRFQISTYNPTILNVTYNFDDFQAVQTNETVNDYTFNNTLLNKFELNSFATNSGITYTNDRNGNANSAVSFGSGGMTATMPLLPYGNAPRTTSLWVKLNAINDTGGTLMYYYGANNNGSGGTVRSTLTRHYGNAPDHTVTVTNVIDTWSHFAFVYDGTISKIYKDGALIGSESKTWNTINNLNQFQIGSPTTNNSFFNGAMDDLKIYNEALTDAQIQNLFNYNSKNVVTSPIVSNVSASNNTPVGTTINYAVNANNAKTTTTIKYGLSAASLTNQVAGLMASGNNLIPVTKMISNLESNTQYFYQIEVTNAAGTTQSAVMSFTTLVAPPAVAEYDFNNTYNNLNGSIPFTSGTGTSFVLGRDGTTQSGALTIQSFVPSATITGLPYGASPRTISFWAQTTFMFNGNNSMFSYGTSGNNNGNTGSFEASQISYSANNNNVVVAATTLQNVWYYYTYIYDGVNAKIYRNGVLLTSEPKSWNTINNNDIFRLGTGSNNVGGFIGSFDDLKIFDYAISDNQINNLYLFNSVIPPTVTMPVISDISSMPLINTANITYNINENYAPTTSVIKYGITTSLTSQIAGFSTSGNSLTATSIISNLLPTTQYYYQIEATNSMGTTISPIESFTTVANLPTLAAYSFNNTLNNTVGTAPFTSNSNLSYAADRNATASSALRIYGTGTSATIANLPTGTAPRTVSIWYKVSTASNDNCLFVYGQSGGQNAYGVSFNNANAWYNFAWNTNTPFTNSSNDGAWHHLVTTFDASKTSKVYIDGVLKATVIQTGWNTSVNNNTFWLAGLFSSTASTFDGTVDDLMIYDFALTSDQVLNLFNSPTLSSQDFNQNTLVVALYPNPTNDVLNIEIANEIKSVEIYNITGQKVKTANQKQINVSNLASGMYLIKIQDQENRISTKKFMKK